MEHALLFIITLTFGGMVAFQVLFAPLLFIKLESAIARPFIRAFFPFYYLYFGLLTVIGFVISLLISTTGDTFIMGLCALGFLVSRQILMPKANAATDAGNKRLFDIYHRATVLINTLQLIGLAYLLYHFL